MATAGACDACLTLPPVQAQYSAKGDYSELANLKTYVTGPTDADAAIVLIYDVFGFSPQITQGADMLANSSGGKRRYQVFMPDFLKGQLADPSWFNGTEEGKAKVAKYFGEGGPAHVGVSVSALGQVVEAIKSKYPSIKTFAMIGYCWGAKIVSLSATEGSVFHVAAEVHPSLMQPEDGTSVKIPILILPSKDEDPKLMKAFIDNVQGPKLLETYHDVPHGWMAARGDLENEPGKKEFERGYAQVLNFFEAHLTGSKPEPRDIPAPPEAEPAKTSEGSKFWNKNLENLTG